MKRVWLLAPVVGLIVVLSTGANAQNNVVVVTLGGESEPAPEPPTSKSVFLSTVVPSASLGGPAGADAECQTDAEASGSIVSGVYKAWIARDDLSGDFSSANEFRRHDLPYILPNGTKVADNFSDLIDGNIDAAIDVLADGTSTGLELFVWTGVKADGTFSSNTCGFWTGSGSADVGLSGQTGARWTEDATDNDCFNTLYRLYCFEQ